MKSSWKKKDGLLFEIGSSQSCDAQDYQYGRDSPRLVHHRRQGWVSLCVLSQHKLATRCQQGCQIRKACHRCLRNNSSWRRRAASSLLYFLLKCKSEDNFRVKVDCLVGLPTLSAEPIGVLLIRKTVTAS
jgi:hypothetical protein